MQKSIFCFFLRNLNTEFDKNANFKCLGYIKYTLYHFCLATNEVCVFYALTSVGAFFISKIIDN